MVVARIVEKKIPQPQNESLLRLISRSYFTTIQNSKQEEGISQKRKAEASKSKSAEKN